MHYLGEYTYSLVKTHTSCKYVSLALEYKWSLHQHAQQEPISDGHQWPSMKGPDSDISFMKGIDSDSEQWLFIIECN